VALHARRRSTSYPLAGFLVVLAWGLRDDLRPRRLLLLLGLALGLGAVGALLVTETERLFEGGDAALRLWTMLDEQVLQVLVPLIALLLVGPGFSREIRQRTLVYHLVRPVARSTVFLARFVAGLLPAAAVAVVLVLSTLAFSGVALPLSVWLAMAAVVVASVTVLGTIYYTLSALFRRGLIAGLVYTFVVEGLVAGLPGTIQKFSVRFHARGLMHGLVDDAFAERSAAVARILDPDRQRSLGEELAEMITGQVPYDPPATAALILAAVAAALLAFGVYRIARRDFALKD
jgi:ABC-type transport system involved in multi-copper enzyme maturation permease subunit